MQYPVISEVEFHGDRLTTVREHGIDYVVMKPVVENIGLDWASQTVKPREVWVL